MKNNVTIYFACMLVACYAISAGAQNSVKFAKVTTPVPTQTSTSGNTAGDFYHPLYTGAAWGDYDNDDQLDLFYSDRNLLIDNTTVFANLYQNVGGTFRRITTSKIKGTAFSCPVWVDMNNDGWLDLVLPGVSNWSHAWLNDDTNLDEVVAHLYKNNGDGTFEDITDNGLRPLYGGLTGGKGHHWVAVGDYNNDGYTDIVMEGFDENARAISESPEEAVRALYLYKNIKGEKFELQPTPLMGTRPFHGMTDGNVLMEDFDGDGYLDIFASGYGYSRKSEFHLYWNNGDGTFSEGQMPTIPLTNGSCEAADIDNDGKIDLVMGGIFSETETKYLYICKNNGDRTFTQQDTELEGCDGTQIGFGDVNQDGFVDMFVGGHGTTHEHQTLLYLNKGNFEFVVNGAYYDDPFGKKGHFGRITHGNNQLVDVDNDGYLDGWMTGWSSGGCSKTCGIELWKNNSSTVSTPANTNPVAPTGLSVSFNAKNNEATFTWNSSSDDYTPQTALRYNFYLKKANSDTCFMVVPADTKTGYIKVGRITGSIPGNTYKTRIPSSGTYEWGIQAIDNGNRGSVFTTQQTEFSVSGISEVKQNAAVKVYVSDNVLYYSVPEASKLSICNISGQKTCEYSICGSGTIPMKSHNGVYIVVVKNATDTYPFKVTIK